MENQMLTKINKLAKKLSANKQRKLLRQMQHDLQGLEIQQEIEETSVEKGITIGTYKKNEKPSEYAGIWKGKEIDARELREKAWRGK